MIVKYGTYTHEQGENWWLFQYRFLYNRIGARQSQLNRCTLWGTIIQEDANQTSLLTKIAALENAYAVNYRDLIVYLNDGTTATRHFLINSGTTNGWTWTPARTGNPARSTSISGPTRSCWSPRRS
jgi:hypothetical protein